MCVTKKVIRNDVCNQEGLYMMLRLTKKVVPDDMHSQKSGTCFDIPTPVLLFPAVYGHLICCLWFLRTCVRTLNFLSYVYM